jgi:putative methionine-R-sulfoxide reductase with GAF domain
LACAAYLARFKGRSRRHTESDLRCYLAWCAERGLDPLAATRPHIELYVRWMQEHRRFAPSTVSRRLSIVAGLYRTCVIDGVLEHSPADHVRRPAAKVRLGREPDDVTGLESARGSAAPARLAVSLPCSRWRNGTVSVCAGASSRRLSGSLLCCRVGQTSYVCSVARSGMGGGMDELVERVRTIVAAAASAEVAAAELADAVRAGIGCRWVGLYRVRGDEVANLAWSGPAPPAHLSFPATQGLTGAVLRDRAPVVSNDVARDPRYLTNQDTTGSELIVPIIVGGEVLGTLDVEEGHTGAFTAQDVTRCELLAAELALLYANSYPVG